jgi:hypothetical protein
LGRLQPLEGGYRHRARRQAELPLERRLTLARERVSGKIANGRVVLQMLTSRAPCSNHLRGLEERRRKSISAALAGQGDLKRTARP